MSESLTPISDLELDNGDEITLYKELIRIIERDIDRIEARDTKNGWTSWAVIVGLIYSLVLLFGELRKLPSIPDFNVITIFAFGWFFIHTTSDKTALHQEDGTIDLNCLSLPLLPLSIKVFRVKI